MSCRVSATVMQMQRTGGRTIFGALCDSARRVRRGRNFGQVVDVVQAVADGADEGVDACTYAEPKDSVRDSERHGRMVGALRRAVAVEWCGGCAARRWC